MIKAVYFDFFNTLAQYYPSREQVYLDVCAENGTNLEPKVLAHALNVADNYWRDENRNSPVENKNKLQQFAFYVRYISRALSEAGVKNNKIMAIKTLQRMKKINWEFKTFDDSIPTLSMLKKSGLKVGLISNVYKNIEKTYQSLGLLEFLDFIVTSSEVGCEKPDPRIFQAALNKANIESNEAIYVGDQYQLDIVGARNVGIKAIFLDRDNWFDDITDCPRISSLSQVTEYL